MIQNLEIIRFNANNSLLTDKYFSELTTSLNKLKNLKILDISLKNSLISENSFSEFSESLSNVKMLTGFILDIENIQFPFYKVKSILNLLLFVQN